MKTEKEILRMWTKRVELLMFEGFNSLGLIARAKRFFLVQNISQTERLYLALISMEGNANH